MNDLELMKVKGGAINGTIINSICRLIDTLLDFGRSIGSSLRRSQTNNYCK